MVSVYVCVVCEHMCVYVRACVCESVVGVHVCACVCIVCVCGVCVCACVCGVFVHTWPLEVDVYIIYILFLKLNSQFRCVEVEGNGWFSGV